MRLEFEYPWPCYCNRDADWDNITMFDLSFQTTLHYFKNHSSGYAQFLFKVFGFGIRLTEGNE
jgi:hypothetical protein